MTHSSSFAPKCCKKAKPGAPKRSGRRGLVCVHEPGDS